MTSGPTSSEAEHVFPVATHTERRYAHVYLYTYVPVWPHPSQTEKSSHKTKQHQKPDCISFSGWAGWRFTRENMYVYLYLQICTCSHNVDASGSWAQTASLPSRWPWPPVDGTWAYKVGPQPHSSWYWPSLSCTQSWPELIWIHSEQHSTKGKTSKSWRHFRRVHWGGGHWSTVPLRKGWRS